MCVHVCTERESAGERERESHRNKPIMSIIILDNPELEKVVRECVLRVGEYASHKLGCSQDWNTQR